ncbi:NAD(P)-binding protein [Periconia macrospinosa]|uniref:NAD(P)-binding protein n=1 Tax=Periconia macrospinosa TaxID=97972 RepID=A0A2V1E1N3_9PLEO|nr:NAD(P)-binding protein [Periconia macrospinosa]
MVKIAISGATGGVAQEVLDVLAARKKHEIILISRNIIPTEKLAPGVTSVQTDYKNEEELVKTLQGVNTVLCFIVSQSDPGSVSQKVLINAAVKAGVKRYAPSEWASSGFDHMPWYEGKAKIREYLAELNKENKVLEYCLFHPGLFTNYFARPYKTSEHVVAFELQWDFNGRRAIVIDGTDGGSINFITIKDFTDVIARAVEFEGEWPLVGGIRGDVLTVEQLVALGEKIRGPFLVERVPIDDLKRMSFKTSWLPIADHPAIPVETRKEVAAGMVSGILQAVNAGAFSVTDEWNKLLPDKKFTTAEEFLTEVWEGKP